MGTYLGPLGSWKIDPFDPPVPICAAEIETLRPSPAAARPYTIKCLYCGKPVPVLRTTCENCGAFVEEDTPQVVQGTEALFCSIDVTELVQHPATITMNRQYANSICWDDLAMIFDGFKLTDSGVWLISRTAMGTLTRITTPTGEPLHPLVTSGYVSLLGYPLHWIAQSPYLGQPGDVALVNWRVYHRLNGGWPDEPMLHKGICVSPFVILGDCWE